MFVDHAHVVHRHACLAERAPLGRVDAADAERADAFRDRPRRQLGEIAFEARLPAGIGQRHAVQIAARRGVERVEIGMRVEPQHEKRPPALGRAARNAGDRAGRQAVIAAEEDRHARRRSRHRLPRERLGPGGDLRQRLQRGIAMRDGAARQRGRQCRGRSTRWPSSVSADAEPGRAQRARPHVAAQPAGAVLNRRSQYRAMHSHIPLK